MHIKTILLFASMALASVVFAAPASAVTSELYDVKDGKTVNNTEVEVHLTGQASFSTLGSGIECTVHSTLKNTNGTTGDITKFEITTSTCHGFGSPFGNCVVNTDEVKNLPWLVHIVGHDFTITNVTIHGTLKNTPGKACAITENLLTFAEITGTPVVNGEGGITAVKLSGAGTAKTNIGTFAVGAAGTLEVVGEVTEAGKTINKLASGTYGIETVP